jgi:hypothetical protein
MRQGITDVLSELDPIIATKSLFVLNLKRIGANFWLRLYHMIEPEVVRTVDVILFDTADGGRLKEIKSPKILLAVAALNVSEVGPFGRNTLHLCILKGDKYVEYKLFFSEIVSFSMTPKVLEYISST